MPNNLRFFQMGEMPNASSAPSVPTPLPGLPGLPDQSGRKFQTGVPGFDEMSNAASAYNQDLLTGAPSLDRNRNAGANYAASMGLAPGGGNGDFMDRWNYDLYGKETERRKQQGVTNMLSMLQGFSGTAVASPGQILGDEASRRSAQLQEQQQREQSRQFGLTLAQREQARRDELDLENRRFGLQTRQYDENRRSTRGSGPFGPPGGTQNIWHALANADGTFQPWKPG